MRLSPLLHLLLAIACVWLMHQAAQFGSLWQSVTYPRVDVTVTLKDGRVLQGDVYTTWDRRQFVRTKQADVYFFDFQEMLLEPQQQHKAYPWRLMFPPTTVFWVFVLLELYLLWPLLRSLRLGLRERLETA